MTQHAPSPQDALRRLLKRQRRRVPVIHPTLPPGSAPGTLEVDPDAPPPRLTLHAYGPDRFIDQELASVEDLPAHLGQWPVLWLNVDGLGDRATLVRIAELFDLHRLAMEDVVHVYQRAKLEPYPEHLFIVARMVHLGPPVHTEQISCFLGRGWVITFQERRGDCFDLVRQRIAAGRGRIRGAGADYLCYALLDAIIDGYFPVLETYGDRLEVLEDEALSSQEVETVRRIHAAKRELLTVRRAIWPHREALGTLLREQSPFIAAETQVYLRDCYDHTVQIIDMVETYRELAGGLMDLYLTGVSNRMNEVMKVLTIIATIFIPLGFIAGLYGMNFDRMPELHWRWGYPVVLTAMALAAGGMLLWFRHRGWIGGSRARRDRAEQTDQRRA